MSLQTYIVLVNYNGWADTLECLDSLYRLDDDAFTVVVVDNGSTDGSMQSISDWADGNISQFRQSDATSQKGEQTLRYAVYSVDSAKSGGDPLDSSRLVLVRNPVNLGFAGANNIGILFALSRGDAARVWLLNNDTVVHPRALAALIRRMDGQPKCGMCGSTLLFYNRPDRVQAYGGGRYVTFLGLSWHIGFMKRAVRLPDSVRAERLMNYVVGASLCVSREFLEEVGLMAEDYFLYFEEVDWSFRNRGRFRLAYAPESIVYHKVGSTVGTSSNPLKKSPLCDYYNLRNRLKFTRRYAPWALPGVCCVMVLAVLLRLMLGQWQMAYTALRILSGMQAQVKG